jgi:DNA polymerase-3 subunit chi
VASAAQYWFYHLEASTLEGVLPGLLEKTLEKGWRALVKLPEDELTPFCRMAETMNRKRSYSLSC